MWLSVAMSLAWAGPHEDHRRAWGHQLPPSAAEHARGTSSPSPGPDATVYAYQAYWNADLSAVPWDHITHLAVFSADATPSGSLIQTDRWSRAAEAVERGAPYGVDVHLCVTNFSSTELESLLGSTSARARLVSELVDWLDKTGAHGINVDFENLPLSRRDEMIQFTRELEAAVGSVVLATPAVDHLGAWDYSELTASADLFVMGYGYHWSGSAEAGPTDPLVSGSKTPFSAPWSLAWSIDDYRKWDADMSRVILGLPLYGMRFPTSDNTVPGTPLGSGRSVLMADGVEAAGVHGAFFEASTSSPYTYDGADQIWYPDRDSVVERVAFAMDQELAGVGFWALHYDDDDPELWRDVGALTTTAKTTEPAPVETGDTGIPVPGDGSTQCDCSQSGSAHPLWWGALLVLVGVRRRSRWGGPGCVAALLAAGCTAPPPTDPDPPTVLLPLPEAETMTPVGVIAVQAPGRARAGDVDGDGDVDLVWLYESAVVGLAGRGDGTFVAARWLERTDLRDLVGGAVSPVSAVELADLDGDGRDDLLLTATINEVPTVGVYSQGSWRTLTDEDVVVGAVPIDDLDGDDLPEVVVSGNAVRVLPSGGGEWVLGPDLGFLQYPQLTVHDGVLVLCVDYAFGITEVRTWRVTPQGLEPEFDLKVDYATRAVFGGRGETYLVTWDRIRRFEDGAVEEVLAAIGDQDFSQVVGGDIDGDGGLDLLAEGPDGSRLFLGDELVPTPYQGPRGDALQSLLEDLDGDGRDDLIQVRWEPDRARYEVTTYRNTSGD